MRIEFHKYHSVLGNLILEKEVDNSEQSIGTFDYGNYSLHVKDPRYFQISQPIILQDSSKLVSVDLIPIPPEGYHRFYFKTPKNENTVDLNLEIQNDQGQSCIVNRMNPNCGFAEYRSYENSTGAEIEIIDLQKWAVANYMLYLSPVPTFSPQNCTEQSNYQKYHYHRKL